MAQVRGWIPVVLSAAMLTVCGDGGGDSGGETSGTEATDNTTVAETTAAETSTSGSSEESSTGMACACPDLQGDCPDVCDGPLVAEAGFIDIEIVDYMLHQFAQSEAMTGSAARLWYGFQPADEDPENKPLAVFFNGGPGSSSELLFAYNVSTNTIDESINGGQVVGPNPASWTSIVNVLYIDARVTGFSYNRMPNPDDTGARYAEFATDNFNAFFDGADFVRAVLRFLGAHQQIQANPVVLVGESYGGVRAQVMLDMLLHYRKYGDGSDVYEDAALVDEIQAHYDAVFPEQAGQDVPADVIATQFGHQVLVQPLMAGRRQLDRSGDLLDAPSSPLFDLAMEVGVPFVPCSQQGGNCDPYSNALTYAQSVGRDRYNYSEYDGWLFDLIDEMAPKLTQLDVLTEMLLVDPAEIDWLYAENRLDAYRVDDTNALLPNPMDWLEGAPAKPVPYFDPEFKGVGWGAAPMDGELPATFGDIEPWDRYYMPFNYIVLQSFYSGLAQSYGIDPYDDLQGRLSLSNIVHVRTFITDAAYDLAIHGPGIPPALAEHTMLVSEVVHDTANPNVDRPGEFVITYQDGAFELGPGETRVVRMPLYPDSSHSVALSQPVELLADVEAWLAE